MKSRFSIVPPAAACAAFLLTAGCAAPRTGELEALRPRQVEAYARRARDPRAFLFAIRFDKENDPVFVDTHRQITDHTVLLPFAVPRASALPMIEVRPAARARPYRALLDSTAPENWTAMDRARALDLYPVGPPILETNPRHVEDAMSGLLSVSPAALLDTQRMEALLFFARASRGPLWPLTRVPAAAGADAVFGVPFLRSFAYVQWDYPGRTMVLSAVQSYEPDPDAILAELPVVSFENGIEVRATIEGRDVLVLLDTVGDFAVAMADPSGPVLSQIRLGDLVTRQVRAVSTRALTVGFPETPRIGAQWLSAYRVTLDNHHSRIFIESP